MRKGTRIGHGLLLAAAAVVAAPGGGTSLPLAAQEVRVEEADLPRSVADDVIEFFNDPGTVQLPGRSRIPADRVVVGDVGVLGGPLVVAGRVEGRIVVVNGDLELAPEAVVTEDILVIGGRVTGNEDASLGGTLAVYQESLRYVRRAGRISRAESREEEPDRGVSLGFGQTKFTVRAGTNYNRVEGLPVLFGPVIETGGSNPFRVQALAIWRTERGFNTDDLGYSVRLEQGLGGRRTAWLGATVHSAVEPMERWSLTDLETSLATFVLHRDYRDYHEREGWSAYARLDPVTWPLAFRLEYRHDTHRFAPVGGPWSITRNDDPWRPQPLVAEGRLESVAGEVTLDTRNDRQEPTDGWLITARGRLGVGGSLALPAHTVPTPEAGEPDPAVPARSMETDFSTGFVDARRYLRISPTSSLALRGVVAGAIEERALPPQFQHALGGEGSLPGYRLFSLDCGARSRLVRLPTAGTSDPPSDQFPAYGCDRIAVFQAEYRGRIFVDLGWGPDEDEWDEDWDWHPRVDLSPSWAVFFNMGRGWALTPDEAFLTEDGTSFRVDTQTAKDVGVGLFIGSVGLFWAYPLDGEDQDLNFYIRLNHRF